MEKSALKAKNLNIAEAAVYGAIFVASLLLFAHPDIVETANHARVMLDCAFDGRLLDFYRVVMAHENTLYYINSACYNAAFYMIFALWELPLYLFGRIFGIVVGEQLMWLWAKALPACCLVVNAILVKKLLSFSGDSDKGSSAARALLLNPVAFFFPLVMGQYETVCMVFVLWALIYYVKKDMTRFSLLMGVSVLCKTYSVLLFLPLLLLAEKKLLPIFKSIALCALPSVLMALLFRDTGAASLFANEIIKKLFENKLWGVVPVFPAFLAAVCAWCWLRKLPDESAQRLRDAAATGLLVFGGFLLTVKWNPQWIYLLIPFWVVCVYMSKNKTLYYYLSPITAVGAVLYCWYAAPGHLEANLMYFGVLGKNFDVPSVLTYLQKVPVLNGAASALVFAALAVILFTRVPVGGSSLADRAAENGVTPVYRRERLWLWAGFAAGCGFWLCGVLGVLVKNGIL